MLCALSFQVFEKSTVEHEYCFCGMMELWGKCFLFSGQYKRSVSDVKEDATVSEGAEHGELH